ncbi:hypothetical protein D3C81_1698590 [compost metagenome]
MAVVAPADAKPARAMAAGGDGTRTQRQCRDEAGIIARRIGIGDGHLPRLAWCGFAPVHRIATDVDLDTSGLWRCAACDLQRAVEDVALGQPIHLPLQLGGGCQSRSGRIDLDGRDLPRRLAQRYPVRHLACAVLRGVAPRP